MLGRRCPWCGSPNRRTGLELLALMPNRSKSGVRQRLIEDGLLENKCAKCGLSPKWCGELLTLQLDHIDGDRDNWKLENLRLLCPNCHTQTPTYARGKR